MTLDYKGGGIINMLAENQLIEVKIRKSNIEHFLELGYEVKKGDVINVPPQHLKEGSHLHVIVLCDVCKKPMEREYRDYLAKHTYDMDCCTECKYIKSKQTNRVIYGTDNPAQSEEVKEKMKVTNLQRYGVENASSAPEIKQKRSQTFMDRYNCKNPGESKDFQDKQRQTMLARYGVGNPMKSEAIRNKAKQTNLLRYGVESPMQNKEIQARVQETCAERYGVINPFMSDDIKIKIQETLMEKYQVTNPFASDEIKEKIRQTNIKKYGVPYIMQSKEMQEKTKQNNLLKYGVEHVMQNPEINAKARKTMRQNGTCPTSQPQLQLYEMIKDRYPEAELNYPFSTCSLDIFVCIDGVKIDCEYDGYFWHSNQQRDIKRDKYLQSQGFKTLRVRSGHKLPTEEELFSAIDYLVNTEHHFKEIVLSDWKDPQLEDKEVAI